MRRSLHRTGVLLGVILVSAIATGCGLYGETTYTPKSTAPSDGPGSIVRSEPFAGIDESITALGATATRIVYRSTSAVDGSPTEVSGSVFVPAGSPPKGGWPVIAFAHNANGMNRECAPSLSPTLANSVGFIAGYLRVGYALTLADYQGLGVDNNDAAFNYIDAKTAARNIVDSVRALRALNPSVSGKWAVIGGGQGGRAAWAVNELSESYGKGLSLVGAVAVDPLVDIAGLAQAAADRTLNPVLYLNYIWSLMSVAQADPGFPLDDYRRGFARDQWDQFRTCHLNPGDNSELAQISPDDLTPATPAATQRLVHILQAATMPQGRGGEGLLVIYGGDVDTPLEDAIQVATTRACELGTIVSVSHRTPQSQKQDLDEFAGWLLARMDGLPPPNNC